MVRDVLAASLEAFVEHGYAGLSIEDVASRARVNKTTIYRRWPTRAELIREALLSLRPEEHSVPNTGSVREDLFVFLKQRAQMLGTPYRRAIAQALLLSGGDPELQAVMERIRRDRPLVPSSLFERAIERGELPAQIDLQLFIDVLLGPLHLRTYWRQEPVTDQFLRDLVDLVVHGANTQRTIAPR